MAAEFKGKVPSRAQLVILRYYSGCNQQYNCTFFFWQLLYWVGVCRVTHRVLPHPVWSFHFGNCNQDSKITIPNLARWADFTFWGHNLLHMSYCNININSISLNFPLQTSKFKTVDHFKTRQPAGLAPFYSAGLSEPRKGGPPRGLPRGLVSLPRPFLIIFNLKGFCIQISKIASGNAKKLHSWND